MAVYVDDMNAPFGRLVMSHMIADTHDELIAMADRIGVQRRWIQNEGTYREHFDIGLGKKALAIEHGAILITWAELGQKVYAKNPRVQAKASVPADTDTWVPGVTHDIDGEKW